MTSGMTINPCQPQKMEKWGLPGTWLSTETKCWNIIRPEHHQNWKAEGWKVPGTSIWNQDSWSLESHSNTYRDWCSWTHIKRCKDLVWQARCTWLSWKCTIIVHPWNCSTVTESFVSLSYGECLRHNKHYPGQQLERIESITRLEIVKPKIKR